LSWIKLWKVKHSSFIWSLYAFFIVSGSDIWVIVQSLDFFFSFSKILSSFLVSFESSFHQLGYNIVQQSMLFSFIFSICWFIKSILNLLGFAATSIDLRSIGFKPFLKWFFFSNYFLEWVLEVISMFDSFSFRSCGCIFVWTFFLICVLLYISPEPFHFIWKKIRINKLYLIRLHFRTKQRTFDCILPSNIVLNIFLGFRNFFFCIALVYTFVNGIKLFSST